MVFQTASIIPSQKPGYPPEIVSFFSRCFLSITRTWVGATGNLFLTTKKPAVSKTFCDGSEPSTILQKRQSLSFTIVPPLFLSIDLLRKAHRRLTFAYTPPLFCQLASRPSPPRPCRRPGGKLPPRPPPSSSLKPIPAPEHQSNPHRGVSPPPPRLDHRKELPNRIFPWRHRASRLPLVPLRVRPDERRKASIPWARESLAHHGRTCSRSPPP